MSNPLVSVILVARDGHDTLERQLAALSRQDYPADRIEVVVGVDGDNEETIDFLRAAAPPFALAYTVVVDEQGDAVARREAAGTAQGDLLVFLRADVEPDPGLLAAYVRAYDDDRRVAIGYLEPELRALSDPVQIIDRTLEEARFRAMRRSDHRYTFQDLIGDNFAVGTDLYDEAGGYDPSLGGGADCDLAVRLLRAGAEFRFVPDAVVRRTSVRTLADALAAAVAEGRGHVRLLGKHGELLRELPLGVFDVEASPRRRRLRRLAFAVRPTGALLQAVLVASRPRGRRARRHGRDLIRLDDLLYLAYWRGVAREARPVRRFVALASRSLAHTAWSPAVVDVDLMKGLGRVLAAVDRVRPDGVRIRYGVEPVGEVPARPGSERVKGLHVRRVLATDLALPLVAALGKSTAINIVGRADHLVTTGPLPAEPFYFA